VDVLLLFVYYLCSFVQTCTLVSDTLLPNSRPRIASELPALTDPLGEILRLVKLTGVLYCQAELTAPWGIDLPRLPGCIMIQIVNSGACWLDIAGQAPKQLKAGSLAMMPHGTRHQIRSHADTHATLLSDIPIQLVTDRYEIMHHGGGGELTRITYCGVRVDHLAAQRLLQVLPLIVQVDSENQEDDWLHDTVRLIAREAKGMRPGGETVITRLADIVVIQAIRWWIATSKEKDQGWLAALRDKYIGRALTAIHRSPARDWSVNSLAQEVGLSRSGFAARFTQLVGQPAMQYVTEWRMQLARVQLLETKEPLAVLADQFGYQSEAAFSRAFKRVFGTSPGRIRKR